VVRTRTRTRTRSRSRLGCAYGAKGRHGNGGFLSQGRQIPFPHERQHPIASPALESAPEYEADKTQSHEAAKGASAPNSNPAVFDPKQLLTPRRRARRGWETRHHSIPS
jgi:hypothetical protein